MYGELLRSKKGYIYIYILYYVPSFQWIWISRIVIFFKTNSFQLNVDSKPATSILHDFSEASHSPTRFKPWIVYVRYFNRVKFADRPLASEPTPNRWSCQLQVGDMEITQSKRIIPIWYRRARDDWSTDYSLGNWSWVLIVRPRPKLLPLVLNK